MVVAVDILRSGPKGNHDMLQPELYGALCTQGRVVFIGGGPNCRTWSILRHIPKPGAPTPVRGRTRETLWGLPHLDQAAQTQLDEDSTLILRQMYITSLARASRSAVSLPGPKSFLEHPEDPVVSSSLPKAKECSSFWITEEGQLWMEENSLAAISFDQCRLGQLVKKATTLATDLPLEDWVQMRCTHLLQPFWSWKKACTTSGRPPKLVRALAILLGRLFNQRFPLASPFAPTLPWTGASDAGAGRQADHAWVGGWCSDVPNPEKSRVKWFQHRITPEGEPWAFATGDPQRAIAALELFGLLLLVRAVLLCAAGSASHTRILVASDNQGNVFSLLNDSTRRMPNAAILMEIVLTLHDQQVMLGPSHVKRDFNTWADELTHPDPQFPTENRVFPSVESELITLIFATFLPHP